MTSKRKYSGIKVPRRGGKQGPRSKCERARPPHTEEARSSESEIRNQGPERIITIGARENESYDCMEQGPTRAHGSESGESRPRVTTLGEDLRVQVKKETQVSEE